MSDLTDAVRPLETNKGSENLRCLVCSVEWEGGVVVSFLRLRQHRSFGAALCAGLLVGGGGMWVLRQRTELPFENTRGGALSALGGGADEGGEVDDPFVFSGLPGQVLRTRATDSTAEDRQVIWQFLKENFGSKSGSRDVNWFEADEALTWLRGASVASLEVEAGLIELAADKSLLEPLRCFALHHLGMWAEAHDVGFSTLERLRSLVEEQQTGATPTAALRVLNRVSSSPQSADWLRDLVVRLVGIDSCPSDQRVAALQIAVELGATEVEPFARLLVDPTRQHSERVNAFLAMGHLGNQETLRWIESQPEPLEILVKEARQAALRSLAGR